MVELLKQSQYQPLTVEKQILIIYAGTQGHLDDLPVEAVPSFEPHLFQYAEGEKMVLAEIRAKKELTDALRAQLDQLIGAAKAEFVAAKGIKAA